MKDIPISFDYKGKHYAGFFAPVHGAGAKGWYLMIDNFYRGRLSFTDKWIFTSQTGEMEDLTDFFGEYVTLWCE